jgi:hypothetical protein
MKVKNLVYFQPITLVSFLMPVSRTPGEDGLTIAPLASYRESSGSIPGDLREVRVGRSCVGAGISPSFFGFLLPVARSTTTPFSSITAP